MSDHHTVQLAFVATVAPNTLPDSDKVTGTIYAIYLAGATRGAPFGWVGQGTDNQWWCWNSHGDFWSLFGKTRDAAARGMLGSSWRYFSRRKDGGPVGDAERERIFAAGAAWQREQDAAPSKPRAKRA